MSFYLQKRCFMSYIWTYKAFVLQKTSSLKYKNTNWLFALKNHHTLWRNWGRIRTKTRAILYKKRKQNCLRFFKITSCVFINPQCEFLDFRAFAILKFSVRCWEVFASNPKVFARGRPCIPECLRRVCTRGRTNRWSCLLYRKSLWAWAYRTRVSRPWKSAP